MISVRSLSCINSEISSETLLILIWSCIQLRQQNLKMGKSNVDYTSIRRTNTTGMDDGGYTSLHPAVQTSSDGVNVNMLKVFFGFQIKF